MIVVSDSAPLITLARCNHLELLREFYGQVLVSNEVYEEVTVAGANLPGAVEVATAHWIHIRADTSDTSDELKVACAALGVGERSAIFLAASLKAGLVLIDGQKA